MEFAANLRYTLINTTALTRFPPPPLNKVEVLKVYTICKRCLTSNTQPSVPNVLIRNVAISRNSANYDSKKFKKSIVRVCGVQRVKRVRNGPL